MDELKALRESALDQATQLLKDSNVFLKPAPVVEIKALTPEEFEELKAAFQRTCSAENAEDAMAAGAAFAAAHMPIQRLIATVEDLLLGMEAMQEAARAAHAFAGKASLTLGALAFRQGGFVDVTDAQLKALPPGSQTTIEETIQHGKAFWRVRSVKPAAAQAALPVVKG